MTIASARFSIGFAYLWHDDLEQAAEHLEAALASSEATGNSVLRATRELTMPEYEDAAHGHLAWLAWRCRGHGACRREGHAAALLDPNQQRLPDGLTEAVERAVQSDSDPPTVTAALERSVDLAVRTRLL